MWLMGRDRMKTKRLFETCYIGFSMNFFHEVFNKNRKPEDTLTTSETFCMEVIYSLGKPTVNQFASYLHLTSPNAAYKVNHLVKKGYLDKVQSEQDKRVFYLIPTKKYHDNYAISHNYVNRILNQTKKRLTKEEWATFGKILSVIQEEQEKDKKGISKGISSK